MPIHTAVTDGRVRILVGTERELGHLVAMFAPAEAGVASEAA